MARSNPIHISLRDSRIAPAKLLASSKSAGTSGLIKSENNKAKLVLILTGIIFPANRGIPRKKAPVLKKTSTHTIIS
jgi:hypothetical protein